MQPTHFAVEILETGREPGELAFTLVGTRGHVDGRCQCGLELLKSSAIAPGFCQIVQAALGVLNLIARREIDRRVEGDVDHVLADLNQVAPDREIIDRATIIDRIDDGGRFGGKASEILRQRQPGDVDISRQKGLQSHRRGELAGSDQAA